MRQSIIKRKLQSGVMLLEALIGILIFSLGVLALVGMQALATKTATDARDRAEASNLASQLLGNMWLDRVNLASYAYAGGGTPPAVLTNWVAQVSAALPDVANNQPIVSIAPPAVGLTGVAGNEVIVTIRWQPPGTSTVHQFLMTGYIN